MIRIACIGLTVLAMVGCSGSGSSSSSSSGGALSLRDLVRQEYQALCEYNNRCASVRGPTFATTEACTTYWVNTMETFFDQPSAQYGGQTAYQWYDAHFNIDSGKVSTCLGRLSTLACDNASNGDPDIFNTDADCKGAFTSKTTPLAAGQGCNTSTNLCDRDLICATSSNSSCYTCQTRIADGAHCTDSYDCQSRFCGSSNTCTTFPAKAKGAACTSSSECIGNLSCDHNVCAARVLLNADCTDASCVMDLECDATSHTCKTPAATGAACDVGATPVACSNSQVCQLTNTTGTAGTCIAYSSVSRTDGQACAIYQVSTYSSAYCAVYGTGELYGDIAYDASNHVTGCTCRTRKADNQPCTSSEQCHSEICSTTCQPKKADGATCSTSTDCLSDHCDSATLKCVAAPVCP